MPAGERAHFGFSTVPLDEKQKRVDDVFHKVADRYDLMNDLMSGGLHRLWKEALVGMLPPPAAHKIHRHLDVAGGTGDVALRIRARFGGQTRINVLDINEAMLRIGRERAERQDAEGIDFITGNAEAIDFIQGNAEALPFADRSFDSYTIAFGIRNVPRIDLALAEAFRVLKRGGKFLCLEFSSVDLPYLEKLYDAYSFRVIPQMGRLVTGEAGPYRYLVESIRRFPKPAVFSHMIEKAGFGQVRHRPLSGNIAAIHSAWKL